MRITAERLSYTYNAGSLFATAALKDVSLTIEEGEFFGIIGHTGSGKSTFVQHLNGLLRVPSSLKRYREKKKKKGKPVPPKTVLTVGDKVTRAKINKVAVENTRLDQNEKEVDSLNFSKEHH